MNKTKVSDNVSDGDKINNKKNTFISFFLLLIFGSCIFYWSLPSYMLYIDSKLTQATVLKIEKHYIQYKYSNKFDQTDYVLSREINKKAFELLKDDKQINILYPNYFPTYAIIQEIDKKKPIMLLLLPHALILFVLFLLGKDIVSNKGG